LHASVVNNHLLELNVWELGSGFSAAIEEKSINQFHDVSLVDSCDLLSTGQVSVFEGVVGNSRSSSLGDDLQRFVNSWVNFVLDTRVFTFEIVSDDDEIDIFVSGVNIWELVNVSV
jgi:hypothetical protein